MTNEERIEQLEKQVARQEKQIYKLTEFVEKINNGLVETLQALIIQGKR